MRFGVEAVDRSYLRHAKNREVIGTMLEDLTSESLVVMGLKQPLRKFLHEGSLHFPEVNT